MQIQTVFKAGNSDVISIPTELKIKTGIKAGSSVFLGVASDGKTIMVSHVADYQTNSITPEFVGWIDDFNKKYSSALKELSEK